MPLAAALLLTACAHSEKTAPKPATGYSEPDLGWLFLGDGP